MKQGKVIHTEATGWAYLLATIMMLIPCVNFFFWVPIVFMRKPVDKPTRMSY